jgi:PAS domain S-box-containing protein
VFMDYSSLMHKAVLLARQPTTILVAGCSVVLLLIWYRFTHQRVQCCSASNTKQVDAVEYPASDSITAVNLSLEFISIFQVISAIVDHDAVQMKSVEDVFELLAQKVLGEMASLGVLGISIEIRDHVFVAGECSEKGWEIARDILGDERYTGTLLFYGAVAEEEYPEEYQKLCLKIADYLAGRLSSFLFLKSAMQEVALFRHLIDQATEIILIIDPLSGKILDVNARACIELGYAPSQLAGKRLGMILDAGKSDFFGENESEKYGHEIFMETNLIRNDQSQLPVEMSLKNIDLADKKYQLVMARDLSSRNEMMSEKIDMERQLIQSEKMASVGQLSAGIAHEINNPISFIMSNLGTMAEYVQDVSRLLTYYRNFVRMVDVDSDVLRAKHHALTVLEDELEGGYLLKELKDVVSESIDGASRIKKIVQDMKSFAHPGEDKLKETDINAGLESTLNIAWNELKYKVEVVTKYGDLPLVFCFPQQVNQVFMNILVNAGQSIEKDGVLTIQTSRQRHLVVISISDNGCGMDKDTAEHIFEPFYTTKEVGMGTGLGLNVAYNIIKKHNGTIRVESVVGEGTTFTISLPIQGPEGEGRGV